MGDSLRSLLDRALRHLSSGEFGQAESIYRQIIAAVPGHAPAHNNRGIALQRLARGGEAIASFRRAIELKPDYVEARNNLGSALDAAGAAGEAVACLQEALRLRAGHAPTHYNLGNALKTLGRLEAAVVQYQEALRLKPDFAGAANNLGGVLQKLGRFAEAEELYRQLAAAGRGDARVHYNLGALAQLQADAATALENYRRALELDPRNADAHNNLGNVLRGFGRLDEAADHYRQALALAPDHAEARNNLGNSLRDGGRLDEAREWYEKALAADPAQAEACANMASVLKEKGQPDQAMRWLRRALELKPNFPEALYNLGNLMQEHGRRAEAIACYENALKAKPDYPEALCGLLHQRLHVCHWAGFEDLQARVRALTTRGNARMPPFALLGLELSPAEQLAAARNWARTGFGPLAALRARMGLERSVEPKRRLRIGYLSADFRAHPVAYLSAGLFELHDRASFEVHGYGCGPDDGSAMRKRMIEACDRFTDVRGRSYEDCARAIHADGIDILVDLVGYTQWSRPEILALRPAPVQVNFLGFPGTLGADFMDYIVADDFLIPEHSRPHYSEAAAYLPSYQPNDQRRPRPGRATRAEHDLPADAFVFCCFNQTFKILPATFDVWMRLLQGVPGSVLWLTRSNEQVAGNLRREAAARGVDPQRLVFAKWIQDDLEQHYARVALADLFLDTYPFNANATASDALWCGVPVLTRAGETFISRAAGGLLTQLELPELITHSPTEYERRALELARAPAALASLRERLFHRSNTARLFDTARYVGTLESLYRAMWERRIAAQPPTALHAAHNS
jgi:protein O-GlcNAc transferase